MKALVLILVVLAAAFFFLFSSDNTPPPPAPMESLTVVPADPNQQPKATDQEKESGSLMKSEDWKSYLDKYAGSEPWTAVRKNQDPLFVPTEQEIKAVLSGTTKFKFDPPLYEDEKIVKTVDLSDASAARRFEVHDQIDIQTINENRTRKETLAEESRFTKMREAMKELVVNRTPTELVLIHAGELHTLDLYFGAFMNLFPDANDPIWEVRNKVMYVSLPFKLDSQSYTPEYWKFFEAYTGTPIQERLGKGLSSLVRTGFLSRLLFFYKLNPQGIKFEQITQERELETVGSLVFMDIHNTRFPEVFADMPSAVALREAGFDKITIGLEGLKYGQDYDLSIFDRFHTYKMEDVFFGKRAEDDKKFYKQFRPKAFGYLQQGVLSDETSYAFHRKVEEWRSGGMSIRVTGLEEFDRFDRERLEKAKEEEELEDR